MATYQAIRGISFEEVLKQVAQQLIPGCISAYAYNHTAGQVERLRREADWGSFRSAEACLSEIATQTKFMTRTQAQQIVDIYNDDYRRGLGCNQVRYTGGT